jgi:hypothetical protein
METGPLFRVLVCGVWVWIVWVVVWVVVWLLVVWIEVFSFVSTPSSASAFLSPQRNLQLLKCKLYRCFAAVVAVVVDADIVASIAPAVEAPSIAVVADIVAAALAEPVVGPVVELPVALVVAFAESVVRPAVG